MGSPFRSIAKTPRFLVSVRSACRDRQVLHVGPVAAERPGTDPSVSRAKAANPRAGAFLGCGSNRVLQLIPSEGPVGGSLPHPPIEW